ncbi:MAG: RidA family protein [Sphingomonas sp.]|uniref:RidA family protein n=1 Tax=Sphingomonas sp. TaxID=28214 RepID=UPI001AC268F0|nr:RidA family protein [Sphingomonas sp.]MBN8814345.1 RidA family protein [Sphingomonas sp.]
MSTRNSIVVDGFAHGAQPIPAASRVGPLLMTGGVHGIDRATGKLADTLEDQVAHMFDNLAAILQAGGGGMEHLVKLTIYAGVPEVRAAVNARWEIEFPDPTSRPARHTLTSAQLRAPMLVQCDATAFIMT